MLVTPPGSDPGNELQALATTLQCRLISVSLGGDNHNVLDTLQISAKEGQWVCLKNLHLAIQFLPLLEREWDRISDHSHSNFRLWFTTERYNSVSSSLIEYSFKIAYQNPTGLKENVKKTFARREEQSLVVSEIKIKNGKKAKLLFILAWTHAILQERGLYGPQSWRLNYEFTTGDIDAAEKIIETFHDANNAVEIIRFFLIHFIYGGKISDCCDRNILRAYVDNYFREDVLEGHNELFPGFRIDQIWDNQSCHRAIREIPTIINTPSIIFGLPDNIMRSVQTNIVSSNIQKLQKLESKHSINRSNSHWWHAIVEPIIQHWENISHNISNVDMIELAKDSPDNQFLRFLQSELRLGQNLTTAVSSSINLLQKAKNGSIDSDSNNFQQLYNSLLDGLVPPTWKELWSGPINVKAWLTEMAKKKKKLHSYVKHFDIFRLDHILELSDFYNASAFLCAMRQRVSKARTCTMDDVIIFSQFDSGHAIQVDNNTEIDSIRIGGLLLRGCSFDEKVKGKFILHPVKSNAPDFQRSPPIRLDFLHPSTFHLHKRLETVLIPVYRNSLSDNILFQVSVDCKRGTAQNWILSGAALYLEC